MGYFGLPQGVADAKPVTGKFETLEPGVYMGRIKEIDTEFKSANKGTPGINVKLEVVEGTEQESGQDPGGKLTDYTMWIPKRDDSEQALEFKNGTIKNFCIVTGLPEGATGFDPDDLTGTEVGFRVNMGAPVPSGKNKGKRYPQVQYIFAPSEWSEEWAKGPEKSDGIPIQTVTSSGGNDGGGEENPNY